MQTIVFSSLWDVICFMVYLFSVMNELEQPQSARIALYARLYLSLFAMKFLVATLAFKYSYRDRAFGFLRLYIAVKLLFALGYCLVHLVEKFTLCEERKEEDEEELEHEEPCRDYTIVNAVLVVIFFVFIEDYFVFYLRWVCRFGKEGLISRRGRYLGDRLEARVMDIVAAFEEVLADMRRGEEVCEGESLP